MTTSLTSAQMKRYARHILLPSFDFQGQEALFNAKVLIIGLGGLGCAASQYLVASGVGTVTLVDDDLVDESNLHRQVLHLKENIGLSKVESAKSSLKKINGETKIETISKRLDDEGLKHQIERHDIVLDCSDNKDTRLQINRLCFNGKTPLVSGAAIRFEGQVSTFAMDGKKGCYQCLSQLFGEPELTCMESGVLSPVVGVIGSLQATEAIKVLTGVGDTLAGKLLLLDGLTSEFKSFKLPEKNQCELCG